MTFKVESPIARERSPGAMNFIKKTTCCKLTPIGQKVVKHGEQAAGSQEATKAAEEYQVEMLESSSSCEGAEDNDVHDGDGVSNRKSSTKAAFADSSEW